MGGGVGLSAHSSHRVVTERTKLAMPEVGLGFFPDVGGTWLLSRSPGEIGTYFGLTGQTMNGPDAVYAGFADAVVPSGKLAALREALTKLRRRCDCSGSQKPDRWICDRRDRRDRLRRCGRRSTAGLPTTGCRISSLRCRRMVRSWRNRRSRHLNEKSPRGMVVALKLLRLARASSSLEQCLVREYRAALEVFASDDFREGVRAAVIDKDRNPKWSPPRIEDVTPEMTAPYFAEIGADELVFNQPE